MAVRDNSKSRRHTLRCRSTASAKEAQVRDDMIRVVHRAGASLRQLAEVAGLGRKTVTAIVERDPAV